MLKNFGSFRCRKAFGVLMLVAVIWPHWLIAQPIGQAAAADQIWSAVENLPNNRSASAVGIRAQRYKGFQLNHARLNKALAAAPDGKVPSPRTSAAIIELPRPDGTMARFRFVEASVMAPELAARFPEIKTYVGEGVDDPGTSVRFDFTPAGFHAQVRSAEGTYYVDPAFRGEGDLHTAYFKRDYARSEDGFQCLVVPEAGLAGRGTTGLTSELAAALARSGNNLRTYRLAVAATAEYTAFHGGTVAGGLAAIVTAINRVTGVYESELAIRLELVANNDLIIYTNSTSDPYSNGNPSSLLSQNQTTLDNVIGSENYDLGHVFSTAGGGLAALGVVCRDGMKAQGETGTASPIGDAFYIDYVAHELGHQFGANHTFNSSASNCGGGNRNGSTAYERGSGSTIMSYAGICSSDNLQVNSDPFFHSASFDEILAYSTGGGNSCAVITSTGNNAPMVNAGANYIVPQNTPFTLTATGSDPDGDPLTYGWEERDLGPATSVSAADNGSSPLFRAWPPTSSPSRTFPRLTNLLNNSLPVGEVMPTTSRTMNFRVTARDNRAGGGGVSTADMQVIVTASAGPFEVTSHNSSGVFSGVQIVTWNVAGTTGSPVNTANVNILLSTDGGLTYPITLLAGTPNDGSQMVVFPNLNTTTARLKVEAVGNIYFDIGNADFTIIPDIPTPLVTIDSAALVAENCLATNNAIDPDESVTVNFTLKNIGTADLTNLVATLLTTNGVSMVSAPQNFGALIAGGAAVTLPFSFVATGACGGVITAALDLQEGSVSIGSVSRNFNLGGLVAATLSHSNAAEITVPDAGTAGSSSPYPSTIAVSGINGTVSKVTVTLKGFSHTWPADLDVLLVGPSGQTLVLMSDAGGGNSVSGLNLTFDDAAPATLSDVAAPVSGTFKPTNYGSGDTFSSPAPGGPYGSSLGVFNGLNPNGEWLLYVQDDASQDIGRLTQGWQLNLTTSNAVCCGDSPIMSEISIQQFTSVPTVNFGSNVTFSLIVSNSGPDAAMDVVVTNTLPAQLSFVSAVSSHGSMNQLGGAQIFNIGPLASNEFATLVVQAVALAAGACSNQAVAACATLDLNYANNTSVASVYVNSFPSISAVAGVITNEDHAVGPLDFTVDDAETPAVALMLSAVSSDTNLVPPGNIVFDGLGGNRSLTITPAANQHGEAQIKILVFDGLATTETSFTVTVQPVNDPPSFQPVPDFVIVEGQTLSQANVVNDPDVPPQALWFGLADAPPGAMINPANGAFSWTPDETQGGSTNLVWVVVTDDGVPSLSATQSFTVIVLETNTAPMLAAIPDLIVTEGDTLTFAALANDTDLPANELMFGLVNAPVNLVLNPLDGEAEWTPSEEQGGSTNVISLFVTDNGVPSLSATQSFTIVVLKSNTAPVLAAITNHTIYEGWTLAFTNFATDADLPVNTLTFSLENAPVNATINSTNGVFLWTPDENDGGVTNLISVIVTDDGTPGLTATQSFTVIVLGSNTPPVLAPIGNYVIAEGETLSFSSNASDSDQPANALRFSLHNAPTNAVIDPDNGWFIWTPGETQGPGTNWITVIVTDDGVPGLSATQSFSVVVLEVNDRPVLNPIADFWIAEGETLVITNFAADADVPGNNLLFSLASAPTNASIDPVSGVLTWTPNESQGPGSYSISIGVTDDGVPSLGATQSFMVFVSETNLPPALAPIEDYKIHAGMTLSFTNAATDPDSPPNALAFSLDADAPPEAIIGSVDGVFTWTPADTDANTVRSITVRVTDDGAPPRDVARTFLVTVVSRPTITGIQIADGVANVNWTSLAGQGYRLQFKTNISDAGWADVLPDVIAEGSSVTHTNAFDPSGLRVYRVMIVP